MNRIILPKRSLEFGVGKEMAGSVYIHRQYVDRLGVAVLAAKAKIPSSFDSMVIKYNRRTGAFSFIESPGFDAEPEPIVGDVWTVSPGQEAKYRPRLEDPYIYHHKWLMVGEDYGGFDVEASRQRSRCWLALEGIDKSRIGRLSYWRSEVLPKLSQ